MIEIKEKKNCSGCNACRSVCPKNAITMEEDEEGFLYPKVDKKKCVNCGLCEKVCTNQKEEKYEAEKKYIYACQTTNEKIRRKSTSGGSFYILASQIFKLGGTVWGAGFDSNMKVIHKKANNISEVTDLIGSKYVQSDLKDCFIEIKNDLDQCKPVLFVGTPCQVEGLLKYINEKNEEYLYTADLKCYGVPSPGLYSRWIEFLEKKYKSKIIDINFRDKKYGYYGTNIKITFENGRILEDCRDSKTYLKTMFSNIGLRPSCYNCIFRNKEKRCDFTLGDIWDIINFCEGIDDNGGTTSIQINTEKGKKLFDSININVKSKLVKVITKEQFGKKMKYEIKKKNKSIDSIKRKKFFSDFQKMKYIELIDKYFPNSTKENIVNFAKPIFAVVPGGKYILRYTRIKKLNREIKKVNNSEKEI